MDFVIRFVSLLGGVFNTIAVVVATTLVCLHFILKFGRLQGLGRMLNVTLTDDTADSVETYDIYLQLLCYKCRRIGPRESSLLHWNVGDLKDSANGGCPVCQLILGKLGDVTQHSSSSSLSGAPSDALEPGHPSIEYSSSLMGRKLEPKSSSELPQETPQGRPSTIQCGFGRDEIIYKVYDCGYERRRKSSLPWWGVSERYRTYDFDGEPYRKTGETKTFAFDFFRQRDGIIPDNNTTSHRELLSSPASENAFKLVSRWLTSCFEGHAKCSQGNTPLPTRILDVSGKSIVLITDAGTSGKYVALSHCWGTLPTLTTTSETLPERQLAINESSLPRTFSDAVKITKALGIQYLWIDSLCIIQDSEEDWLKESSKMKDYYRNSYLTISALDSINSHCGVFSTREEVQSAQLSEPNMYIRPRLKSRHEIFKNAQLNRRAWALQERLLSTRIVHYSKNEIFWECLTCSTRESNEAQHTQKVDPDSLITSEGDDFKRLVSGLILKDSLETNEAMTIWYRLVMQYSRRELTRQSDKLAAISGLASVLSTATNYTYLAGIWKEDILGLLWTVDNSVDESRDKEPILEVKKEQNTYPAPSWSWVSARKPVQFSLGTDTIVHSERDARITDHYVSLVGADQFVQLRGGYIQLCAATCPLFFTPKSKFGTEVLLRRQHNGDSFGIAFLDKPLEEQTSGRSHSCIAVWIIQRMKYETIAKAKPVTRKVLSCLLAVEDKTEPLGFRRIGIAEIDKDDPAMHFFSKPREVIFH